MYWLPAILILPYFILLLKNYRKPSENKTISHHYQNLQLLSQ